MAQSRKVILASASPRRKELLEGLGVQFTVDTLNSFIESKPDGADPHQLPLDMAKGKSYGFHRPLEPDEVLITADTVVILPSGPDGHPAILLGKPANHDEACQMLRSLSGRSHEVVTAVCIRTTDDFIQFTDTTEVVFKEMSDDEINYYVDNFKPYDKAGAYGIQEWIGYTCISAINGSYFNVMGLPVHRLWEELGKFL